MSCGQASIDAIRDSFHDATLLTLHRDLRCGTQLSVEGLRPFVDKFYEACYVLPTLNGFGLLDLLDDADHDDQR